MAETLPKDRKLWTNLESRAWMLGIEEGIALASRSKARKVVTLRPTPAVVTVYFIGAKTGPVKIGFAVNVKARLRELQSGSPAELAVLASVSGPPSLEREYHQRFAAARLHGEWFQRAPEIEAEIARLSPPSVCGMGVA